MYEAFYGFDRPPFANIPDPEFLFPSPQHQQALSILQYALMARAGFCVITGDVGAGKTTLVRKVLQTLDQRIHVGLVSNTQCETFDELLRWILLAFELEYRDTDKVAMYDNFVQFLIRQYRAGTPVTLIIDEAQNLGMENLEQLRMLSNVNTEKGQILQTILIGQPQLWDLLRAPEMEQFAQRISYEYFLQPFDSATTVESYIEHRVRLAGGPDGLFAPETFQQIYESTRGVPRLINMLCDTALVYGYGEESATIGMHLISRVINDKQASFNPVNGGATQEPRPVAARIDPVRTRGKSTIERAAERRRKKI